MVRRFLTPLWENLMPRLLLRIVKRPTDLALKQRAHRATALFMRIHPDTDAIMPPPPESCGTAFRALSRSLGESLNPAER